MVDVSTEETKMENALEHGVRLSQTSPKFLHANSTSHTWIFSAFAELVKEEYLLIANNWIVVTNPAGHPKTELD